jgi:hypothetical protein
MPWRKQGPTDFQIGVMIAVAMIAFAAGVILTLYLVASQ